MDAQRSCREHCGLACWQNACCSVLAATSLPSPGLLVPSPCLFSNTDEDLLAQELRAGVLKPSYVLVRSVGVRRGRTRRRQRPTRRPPAWLHASAPALNVQAARLAAAGWMPFAWLAKGAWRNGPNLLPFYCVQRPPAAHDRAGNSGDPLVQGHVYLAHRQASTRCACIPAALLLLRCQLAVWEGPVLACSRHAYGAREGCGTVSSWPCTPVGASKPHHLVDANGVVLGYSHFGMLAAARWIKSQTRGLMEAALQDNPGGYCLYCWEVFLLRNA